MRTRSTFPDRHKKPFSTPPTPKGCPNAHPCISSPPKPLMSQSEFNYEYSQFTRDLPIVEEVKDNLKYLFELFWGVCEAGGLIAVLGGNLVRGVVERLGGKFPDIHNLTSENIVEHYIKYQLFSFEIVLKTHKRLPTQNLSSLLLPKFLSGNDLLQHLRDLDKGLKLYNEDIVVLEQLCVLLQLEDKVFGLKAIGERYGGELVKVFGQDADKIDGRKEEGSNLCDNGVACVANLTFSVIAKANERKKPSEQIQLSLKQYLNYFKESSREQRAQFLKSKFPSRIDDSSDRILYAFEFDPKDQHLIDEIYKKVQGTFLVYKQKHDLLSYNDEDITGVTFPRFELQIEGNWTGGCQQAFGMARIDINFGPDSNQWYCVSGDNLNKFHSIFKAEYGMSAEKIEGEWFEDIDWFIERKIPIKKLVQKKGDAVVIGAGSMCWQMAKGRSLHASWNVMVKTQKQIMAAINKCMRLKELQGQESIAQCRWHSKVPLKALFLRLLNHEQPSPLPSLIIVREWLKKWTTEQQKYLNQMTVRQDLKYPKYKEYYLFDAESFCSHCSGEILNYFVNYNGLSCLECCARAFTAKKITELKDKNVYFKHEPFWVHQLVYLGAGRDRNGFGEYEEICKGEFVGEGVACAKKKGDGEIESVAVDSWQDWENLLGEYNEERKESLEAAYAYKLQALLSKISSTEKQNELPEGLSKSFCTQTNLSLLCQSTDQQLQAFISLPKFPKAPEPSVQGLPEASNKESRNRKAKRQQSKAQSSQKIDTQCTDRNSQGNFTFGETRRQGRRATSFVYEEKEEDDSNKRGSRERERERSQRNERWDEGRSESKQWRKEREREKYRERESRDKERGRDWEADRNNSERSNRQSLNRRDDYHGSNRKYRQRW